MTKARICPAPGCKHGKSPRPLKDFPAYQNSAKYICKSCRQEASDDDTLGRLCLQCKMEYHHNPADDGRHGICEQCQHHLELTHGRCWLIVSAPTNEGAVWKGRYLTDDRMRESLLDAVFEPGMIVEVWEQWIYKGAYKVVGAQTLLPDVLMEAQSLVVVTDHRIRGDGRLFRRV